MCKACEKGEPSQKEFPWVGYNVATHIVVGYTCSGGGVVATALDQFTAHRCARWLRDNGWSSVQVRPNVDESFDEVSGEVLQVLMYV